MDALVKAPPKRNPKAPRQAMPMLPREARTSGCGEVALGFDEARARAEALRCINCKEPACVGACPLHIDIKSFIAAVLEGDYDAAYRKIVERNPFPDICGRVCQHELYCEKACVLAKKLEPVAIGSLERFVADVHTGAANGRSRTPTARRGPKVALVGSGPASLIAAWDLAGRGCQVKVFEALHDFGGVLRYGIPPFRLPRGVINDEIQRLHAAGVEFASDYIVGKTCSLDELFEEGYEAVFVATGAGLPHLMNIPGEMLVGVYTANEFLTRLNLMEAYRFPETDTPVRVGRRAVVVGGGNAAMDAARWALRLGCETTILFRRGRSELRARIEEIAHAEEEGAHFEFLAAPVEVLGDQDGFVRGLDCIRMRLGERDETGRPSPVPIPGSNFHLEADLVVAAIGQSPNPTLQRATPAIFTRHGKIIVDVKGQTNLPRVFAGGDVVRGGSTVILAMRDGRTAAEAIHDALRVAREGDAV